MMELVSLRKMQSGSMIKGAEKRGNPGYHRTIRKIHKINIGQHRASQDSFR